MISVVRWGQPLILVALFGAALALRLVTAGGIDVPPTEPSAYYAGVARNLVEGRGLVTDAAWSHLAPHPVLPAPAFEFWLPVASFLAAVPMALLGPSFDAAQLSSLVLGALLAPLAWLIARSSAVAVGLPAERVMTVALGSGLAVAVLGPLLVADAAPESTSSFTFFVVAAAILAGAALPRADGEAASRTRLVTRISLGVCLGLAYLARQEVVWFALAYVAVVWARSAPGPRSRLLPVLAPTVVAGALTVAPWMLRNLLLFGSPTPLATTQLAFLVRNEDLFAVTDPPTLERFLAQGPGVIVGNQLTALARNLLDVVLIPSAPLGELGLGTVIAVAAAALIARRGPGLRAWLTRLPALSILIVGGLATYLVTSVIFPVASGWGTFRHAAGPLLVGLTVASVLGLDALVGAAREFRSWPRSNAWLAPFAAVFVALPLGLLQISLFSVQADRLETRYAALRAGLEDLPELAAAPRAGDPPSARAAALSDHPIWLAETLRRPVLALPDESPTAVWQLARAHDVPLLVVIDQRGRYPQALLRGADGCFTPREGPLAAFAGAFVFAVEAGPCGPVARQ